MIKQWPIWDRKIVNWKTYICVWYNSETMREEHKVWGKLQKQVY